MSKMTNKNLKIFRHFGLSCYVLRWGTIPPHMNNFAARMLRLDAWEIRMKFRKWIKNL